MRNFFSLAFFLCTSLGAAALAADAPKTPHEAVADLKQRMYSMGGNDGSAKRFVDAEQNAVREIREYINNGDAGSRTEKNVSLTEKNAQGQSPLMAAAVMGYSEVVSELLKSDAVRKSIDESNSQGVTAWVYTNMAGQQAMFACNPKVFDNLVQLMPLVATLPYYLHSPENPYRKTRRLLEEAGAMTDPTRAKQLWQERCKLQDEHTRIKVQESADILDTVLAENAEIMARWVAKRRSKRK